ncbi:MAG: excinuclease ABC subunit UvrC [Deltaproteobacteria bacterium]|nr:excinuclease ABC subunit UvrC [Deltaproteobacteria bacterium]
MSDELKIKIKNVPRAPGAYLMKDAAGKVIYVGKARDLRNRVRAYFSGTDKRPMIPFLVSRIADVEFIVTGTEKEALILENNLIKEHRPKYNVIFRDDKTYFHIRIDPADRFPRFQLVRRPKKDGARCFGPYPSGGAARETLEFLQSVFLLRTCGDNELKGRKRACLEYEIGRCLAPCAGKVDESAYRRLVEDGIAFLEGKEKTLLAGLKARMDAAATQMRFEEAAALRDRIAAIVTTLEKQRISSLTPADQDVFGLFREGDRTLVCALHVRSGRVMGKKTFPLVRSIAGTDEILSALIKQYYDGKAYIPAEIIVSVDMEDREIIGEWLSEKKGRVVAVLSPQRGQKRGLLQIAMRNAENLFRSEQLAGREPKEALRLLAEALGLKQPPARIECFDISNVGGEYAVGSMVTFVDGVPCKDGYRRFRIRTVKGADDYAMMYEVLKRRYEKKEGLPDLIVVDGGRGHLGVALSLLKDLDIRGMAVIGFAKESRRKNPLSPDKNEDRVYLPRRKDPLYLARWPAAFFLLQRVRDEAHRFAVSYHRRLKEKSDFQSLLDEIPGIGPSRKKALLGHFGDLAALGRAAPEEVAQVPGIGKAWAAQICAFLKARS